MSWMAVSTAAPSASVPNCGPSAKRTVRSVLPFRASSAPAGAKYLSKPDQATRLNPAAIGVDHCGEQT